MDKIQYYVLKYKLKYALKDPKKSETVSSKLNKLNKFHKDQGTNTRLSSSALDKLIKQTGSKEIAPSDSAS